jgi:hypothetical protein
MLFLYAVIFILMRIWMWRSLEPKVQQAHDAALNEAIKAGEFDIAGNIKVKTADCAMSAASWLPLHRVFLGLPVRQQNILWRDSQTGVITKLCLQTTMAMKPGMCVLSSTKPIAA